MKLNNIFIFGVDCLLVLLNILNGGLSVLPLVFLFDSLPYNLVLVAILNMTWCIFNSQHIKPRLFPPTLIPFFSILVYQIILGRFEFSATMLALNLTFFFVLTGIIGKYSGESVRILSDTYIFYSLINVICVCLAFILILQGRLDPFSNSIEVSLLTKDDEVAFFPGYLTVLRPDDAIRVSFLPTSGLFCGFSHEPHVVGYICIPAFFMLLYRMETTRIWTKIIIIALYSFFFLITLSATSFLSMTLTITIGLFMSGRQSGHKFNWVILLALVVGAIFAFTFISDSFSFVFDKLTSEGGSKDYSEDRLSYAFTPNTFLGTTIYSNSINGDIGLITCVLNAWFYISSGLLCYRMLRNNSKEVFFYGLAFFYFLCHSMKAFLMIYRFPFTVFMVFLVYHVLNNYSTQKVFAS